MLCYMSTSLPRRRRSTCAAAGSGYLLLFLLLLLLLPLLLLLLLLLLWCVRGYFCACVHVYAFIHVDSDPSPRSVFLKNRMFVRPFIGVCVEPMGYLSIGAAAWQFSSQRFMLDGAFLNSTHRFSALLCIFHPFYFCVGSRCACLLQPDVRMCTLVPACIRMRVIVNTLTDSSVVQFVSIYLPPSLPRARALFFSHSCACALSRFFHSLSLLHTCSLSITVISSLFPRSSIPLFLLPASRIVFFLFYIYLDHLLPPPFSKHPSPPSPPH